MTDSSVPGFYGKLPVLGDFVNRRLPKEFIDAWDQWLQEAVATSHDQLGEKWLDLYLVSPIWRFVLMPGICGVKGWAGILMPSVDKVGRYFPLTVAVSLPDGCNPFKVSNVAKKWFDQAEEAALSMLEDDSQSLDTFDESIKAIDLSEIESLNPVDLPADTNTSAWRLPMASVNDSDSVYQALLDHYTLQQFSKFSLWWTAGSEEVSPSFLVNAGLPPTNGFSALLEGHWQKRGWSSWPESELAPESKQERRDECVDNKDKVDE